MENKFKIKRFLPVLAAACLVLALLGAGGGIFYQRAYAVASVISLDVNPSIELRVNQNEKVLSCTGLNEDAARILADMDGGRDLEGTKLDVAVNAVVGSLVRNGYLNDLSSAILISVEDRDQTRGARLQQELVAFVDSVLKDSQSQAAVLSQSVAADAALESQAKDHHISTGKAYLVQKIMDLSGTTDDAVRAKLSALSVEELRDLLQTGETRIPIGMDAACQAVREYTGTQSDNTIRLEADPELDNVPAHYEVELYRTGGGELEYIVDAFTGQVLSGVKDISASTVPGGSTGGTTAPSGSYAGETAAKEAALTHAGLTESQVTNLQAKMKYDDGRPECYKVEFTANGMEYEYELDLYDCHVLEFDREPLPDSGSTGSTTVPSGGYAGETAAKEAALTHAGLTESQTADLRVWMEYDDGRPECYKVEFTADGMEYEYELDLYDCHVLDHDREPLPGGGAGHSGADHDEDHDEDHHSGGSQTSDIGAEAAKAAALGHAGLTESQVTRLEAERDQDDGRLEYEVSFHCGGLEYEYTIDGATGAILDHEMEYDD